jgi:serine/threonine protein kinase
MIRQELRTTTGLTIQRTASGMPVVNKQYLLVKRLGEGAQGKVKLVLNLQDMSLYAIKFISKKHLRSSIR